MTTPPQHHDLIGPAMPLDFEDTKMDIVELRVGFESMTNTVSDIRQEFNRRFDEGKHDTGARFDRQDVVLAKLADTQSAIQRSIDERRGRDQVKAWLVAAVGLPVLGWVAVWALGYFFHTPSH